MPRKSTIACDNWDVSHQKYQVGKLIACMHGHTIDITHLFYGHACVRKGSAHACDHVGDYREDHIRLGAMPRKSTIAWELLDVSRVTFS